MRNESRVVSQLGSRIFLKPDGGLVSPRSSCANRTRLQARNNRTPSWMKLKHLGHDPVVDAALKQQERIGEQVIGAKRVVPHAERPGAGGLVERRRLHGLVQQVERVAGPRSRAC